MLRKRSNRLLHKSISITIAFGAIVMLLSFSSCGGKKNTLGDAITERDSLPVMNTLGVTTLISDSGVTRYRVNTEEWTVYDRKKPSYWAFEKGVYLEQFDSIFNIEASIKADTAYYYDKQKLWKLIGNVDIQNRKGRKWGNCSTGSKSIAAGFDEKRFCEINYEYLYLFTHHYGFLRFLLRNGDRVCLSR